MVFDEVPLKIAMAQHSTHDTRANEWCTASFTALAFAVRRRSRWHRRRERAVLDRDRWRRGRDGRAHSRISTWHSNAFNGRTALNCCSFNSFWPMSIDVDSFMQRIFAFYVCTECPLTQWHGTLTASRVRSSNAEQQLDIIRKAHFNTQLDILRTVNSRLLILSLFQHGGSYDAVYIYIYIYRSNDRIFPHLRADNFSYALKKFFMAWN